MSHLNSDFKTGEHRNAPLSPVRGLNLSSLVTILAFISFVLPPLLQPSIATASGKGKCDWLIGGIPRAHQYQTDVIPNSANEQKIEALYREFEQIKKRFNPIARAAEITYEKNPELSNYFKEETERLIEKFKRTHKLLDERLRSSSVDYTEPLKHLDMALEEKDQLMENISGIVDASKILIEVQASAELQTEINEVVNRLQDISYEAKALGASEFARAEILNFSGRLKIASSLTYFTMRTAKDYVRDTSPRTEKLINDLWMAQSSAVRLASIVSSKYANIPIPNASNFYEDGRKIPDLPRGNVTQTPKNELVLIEGMFGFKIYHMRSERDNFIFPVNKVARMDPELSLDGISRGHILKDDKKQMWGVLGFFYNSDVAVQSITPNHSQSIKRLKLGEVLKMHKISTSNIDRPVLIGDQVVRVTREKGAEHGATLIAPINSSNKLAVVSAQAAKFLAPLPFIAGFIGIGALYLTEPVVSYIPKLQNGSIFYMIAMAEMWIGVNLAYYTTTRICEYVLGRSASVRADLRCGVALPNSKVLSELSPTETGRTKRSEELWITSNSLTHAERSALKVEDGTSSISSKWAISPNGEKMPIKYLNEAN